jgi:hypothetical protein
MDRARGDRHVIMVEFSDPARFASIGFEPIGSTPDILATYLKAESGEWGRVVRDAKIKEGGCNFSSGL